MSTTSSSFTHLVVGAGNMGGSLLTGWIHGVRPAVDPHKLLIVDPKAGNYATQAVAKGATLITEPSPDMADIAYVLLAVKPQMFDTVASGLAGTVPNDAVIISIMAGVTLTRLGKYFPENVCVRAMPNTPASIGAGVTAYVAGGTPSKMQSKHVERLLKAGGSVHAVSQEAMIDMVTAVSGSGPAYVFHMVEALRGAAESVGLPTELAEKLARETVIGSSLLLDKSGQSASHLRQAVTSPGGTTEAALDILMRQDGLALLMREAVSAAHKRSKELGQA